MAWISTAFRSKMVNMPVELEILVPQKKAECGFKVLILLHTEGNDRTEWLLKSRIADLVEKEPILVCMPSGKNSFFVNTANGYDYEDFIAKELPVFLRGLFWVSKEQKDWMVAGASMGGYGALICGSGKEACFGKIAALAPTLDYPLFAKQNPGIRMDCIFGENWKERIGEQEIQERLERLSEEKEVELFLFCGKQDEYYEGNCSLWKHLKQTRHWNSCFTEGTHDFSCWNAYLPRLVDFLADKEVLA